MPHIYISKYHLPSCGMYNVFIIKRVPLIVLSFMWILSIYRKEPVNLQPEKSTIDYIPKPCDSSFPSPFLRFLLALIVYANPQPETTCKNISIQYLPAGWDSGQGGRSVLALGWHAQVAWLPVDQTCYFCREKGKHLLFSCIPKWSDP